MTSLLEMARAVTRKLPGAQVLARLRAERHHQLSDFAQAVKSVKDASDHLAYNALESVFQAENLKGDAAKALQAAESAIEIVRAGRARRGAAHHGYPG